jgi:hypothetical protein
LNDERYQVLQAMDTNCDKELNEAKLIMQRRSRLRCWEHLKRTRIGSVLLDSDGNLHVVPVDSGHGLFNANKARSMLSIVTTGTLRRCRL